MLEITDEYSSNILKDISVVIFYSLVAFSLISLYPLIFFLFKKKIMNLNDLDPNFNVDPKWQFKGEDVTIERIIGTGGFSEVFKGFIKKNNRNKEVAIKVFKHKEYEFPNFKSEVELLSNLKHKNVIRFKGVSIIEENLCLMMSYCVNGSLSDLLRDKSFEMNWRLLIKFAIDAANGIYFLHTRTPKIIHKDIKASNILVSHDLTAKISDFGLSKMKVNSFVMVTDKSDSPKFERKNDSERKSPRKTHARKISYIQDKSRPSGTRLYLAPELLKSKPYNETADTYSFGILLLELLRKDLETEISNNFTLKDKFKFKIPQDTPVPYHQMILYCSNDIPEERPTFDKILVILNDFISGDRKDFPNDLLDRMIPL
eukprot:TRINITY_DN5237_c0_g2_i1.p1 TRINITY_DN5237_c0_g2~~TRINITY_DN5237_c0_g2_i1.p1  ORF type:complete len:372 (+),score=97.89 TRINITY_DN5237_c0_g2_i1:30-1145(+)